MAQGPGESTKFQKRGPEDGNEESEQRNGSEAFSHAVLGPSVSEGVYWCDKPTTKSNMGFISAYSFTS